MKVRNIVMVLLIILVALASVPAFAQDHTRGWDNGSVVVVTEVDVHPGMFNAYINDLNNVWRKFMEQQIEDGYVVSYNMYSNASAREGEPDLYLTVTYPNWAAFDVSNEYFEKISEEIMGSLDDMREANIDRGQLRTIMGTMTLQQINFQE
jgi:hypothetical protein